MICVCYVIPNVCGCAVCRVKYFCASFVIYAGIVYLLFCVATSACMGAYRPT